ncbi:hypothetical protein PRNP1_001932 [Phytophthora ramorum]
MDVHLLAVACAPSNGQVCRLVSVEEDLALDGATGFAAGNDVHQCRLARTRRPHQRRHRAGLSEAADAPQQIQRFLRVARVRHRVPQILKGDGHGREVLLACVHVEGDGFARRRHRLVRGVPRCLDESVRRLHLHVFVLLLDDRVLGTLVALVLEYQTTQAHEHHVAQEHEQDARPHPHLRRRDIVLLQIVLAHVLGELSAVVPAVVHAHIELGRAVLVHRQCAETPGDGVDPVHPDEPARHGALGHDKPCEQDEERDAERRAGLGDVEVGRHGRQQEEPRREDEVRQHQQDQVADEGPRRRREAAHPVHHGAEDDAFGECQRDLSHRAGQHVRRRGKEVGPALLVEHVARRHERRHL